MVTTSSARDEAPTGRSDSPPGISALAQRHLLSRYRGAMVVNAAWPIGAAADCAAWLRDLLR